MALSTQYSISCTVVAIVRAGNQLTNYAHEILETACTTVTYAAMQSAFFPAAWMHAIKITQDETKKYEMPRPWPGP